MVNREVAMRISRDEMQLIVTTMRAQDTPKVKGLSQDERKAILEMIQKINDPHAKNVKEFDLKASDAVVRKLSKAAHELKFEEAMASSGIVRLLTSFIKGISNRFFGRISSEAVATNLNKDHTRYTIAPEDLQSLKEQQIEIHQLKAQTMDINSEFLRLIKTRPEDFQEQSKYFWKRVSTFCDDGESLQERIRTIVDKYPLLREALSSDPEALASLRRLDTVLEGLANPDIGMLYEILNTGFEAVRTMHSVVLSKVS